MEELSTALAEKDHVVIKLSSADQSLQTVTAEKNTICAKYKNLNKQLSTVSFERDNVINQLLSAASKLTPAREHAATLTTRIVQFELSSEFLTLQQDAVISHATKLLAGIDDKDHVLTSLTSERDELVSRVEECKGVIARLEAEKVGAVSTVAGLKDTVNGLRRQMESLSAKLREADSKDECTRTQVTNLTSQVSGLTAEREKLATKLKEATSELSEL